MTRYAILEKYPGIPTDTPRPTLYADTAEELVEYLPILIQVQYSAWREGTYTVEYNEAGTQATVTYLPIGPFKTYTIEKYEAPKPIKTPQVRR